MADKLISANALGEQVERLIKPKSTEAAWVFGDVLALIEDAPAVDAEPVVRCKDCKHAEFSEAGMTYCPGIIGSWVEDNWYCADGERREDGKTD